MRAVRRMLWTLNFTLYSKSQRTYGRMLLMALIENSVKEQDRDVS